MRGGRRGGGKGKIENHILVSERGVEKKKSYQ